METKTKLINLLNKSNLATKNKNEFLKNLKWFTEKEMILLIDLLPFTR